MKSIPSARLLPWPFLFPFILLQGPVQAQDGEALFRQNCAACHKMGKRFVGPDLTGVNERRDKAWLHKFIRSSQTLIKEGDPTAVALFNENNQLVMTDQPLDEGQIDQVLAYLATFSKPAEATASAAPAGPEKPIVYTADDRAAGHALFIGTRPLASGGAACISCHNVNGASAVPGGGLAKDLTDVHGRMGHAGIAGILGAPPFPAMAAAYARAPLTEAEMHQLSAYLEEAGKAQAGRKPRTALGTYALFGGGGLFVILAAIGLHWRKRLKGSVKQDILDRQLRSI
ncbi:MAG: c-type cytochrome [Flavobacteriales bacterium]|nr:c-type cytochrome [Flavobacteriales bacterium]